MWQAVDATNDLPYHAQVVILFFQSCMHECKDEMNGVKPMLVHLGYYSPDQLCNYLAK